MSGNGPEMTTEMTTGRGQRTIYISHELNISFTNDRNIIILVYLINWGYFYESIAI